MLFALIAIYFSATGRRRLAATMIATSMVPVGLGMIDGVARMAQYFSLANTARFLNSHAGDRGDVVWKLPGGWKFASQGIVFKHPHADFSNPRGGNSQEFRWHNAHQVKNKGHKYTIHITDGRQTCSYDPTIMN